MSAWAASIRKLRLLWSALLLVLPAVAATNPRVLSKPPRVIAATDTSLTLVADVECPPNCNVSDFTWEITSDWIRDDMRTKIFENENATLFINGLTPGKRYDIRALLQLKGENTTYNGKDVPVTSTYTCDEKVSEVENLTVVERGTTHFVIKWAPGNESCAAVQYFIKGDLYETVHETPLLTCAMWNDTQSKQQYSCSTTHHGPECTAKIDNVEPGRKYALLILAVWDGHCSPSTAVFPTSERQYLLGMSTGGLVTLAAVLILAAGAAWCTAATLRKRRTARAERVASVGRMCFSRRLPRKINGQMYDRDGYLLTDAEVELLSYEKL